MVNIILIGIGIVLILLLLIISWWFCNKMDKSLEPKFVNGQWE